jgi:hydroxymethylglutaryl-CoA lyase
MSSFPAYVKLVEVGPRDGLQNEKILVDTKTKIEFIDLLSQTGLSHIEVGSFVNPKAIPQMANTDSVLQSIQRIKGVRYAALIPNMKGLEEALKQHVNEVAIFTAASDAFNVKNINCTIKESLDRFKPVIEAALQTNTPVRGYVSTVIACPYVGKIEPTKVCDVVEQLLALGCYEVSLGDTIGVGTPGSIKILLDHLLKNIAGEKIAGHFHDTYGQALANIYTCLEYGIKVFDASVAGLGGCPYAPGATGNVASEDVVYLLHGLGIDTHIDLTELIKAGTFICKAMRRENHSKVAVAMHKKVIV